jgi:hypothetical protein
MKMNRSAFLLLLHFLWPLGNPCFAHEVIVHENITYHAESTASQSAGYLDFLRIIVPDNGVFVLTWNGQTKSPGNWMVEGSAREDDADEWIAGDGGGGKRVYNHFYDPLSGQGIANFPPDSKRTPYGRDSFTWGSVKDSPGINFHPPLFFGGARNVNTKNEWSWQNIREFQHLGLTEGSPAVREENLAKMFRGLGDVLHLLQDLSSPQHVRDEHHFDKLGGSFKVWHSPMEKYGGLNAHRFPYTHAILDWRAAGFTKLKDFWDREMYVWNRSTPATRSAQPLIDHEAAVQPGSQTPQNQLGLAEFVNGNFIGDRHTYREVFPLTHPYHYPYPSLFEATDIAALLQNPAANGKPANDPRLGPGLRFIVRKEAQGRTVNSHGAVFYLLLGAPTPPPGPSAGDIFDPEVLKEYHDILIPEAIKYCAGVIDYFFRGRIEVVEVVWTGTQYSITIRNESGQELATGGKFTVWKDDASGDRTQVGSQVALSTALANGATRQFDFPGPEVTTPTKFIVVYQGTIGLTGSSPSDPIDKDIAMAAKDFIIRNCGSTPSTIYDAEWEDYEVAYPFGGDIVHGSGSFSLTVTSSSTAASKVTTICNPGAAYEIEIRSVWAKSGAVLNFDEPLVTLAVNGADSTSRNFNTGPFTDMIVHATIPAATTIQLIIQVGFLAIGNPSATYSGNITITPLSPP